MPHTRWVILVFVAAMYAAPLHATEPNNTFEESTILASGVMSVVDDISPGGGDAPDTMVASRNTAGFIIAENNDGGPWEGALGSGLMGIPINNDSSFWFIVTGYPDFDYNGSHDQYGDYHVYVDIHNDFGEFEETYEYDGTLEPGIVHQFSLDGFNTNYTYDVFIDNTVGSAVSGDVDFFTFSGLTVGASFSVEVTQTTFDGFDSFLGWFDDTGVPVATDDDNGFETLSWLEGVIPASGQLTFAVTGFGDDDFVGHHNQHGTYGLELMIDDAGSPGDFDGDGDVDGRDFLVWQRNPSVGTLADWQANYGAQQQVNVAVVPEPATFGLLTIALCAGLRRRYSSG